MRIRKAKKNRQHYEKKTRSTKHTNKAKDRVTQTPIKTGDELSCSNILKLKVSHVCYNSLRKLKISYLGFAGFQNTFIYL